MHKGLLWLPERVYSLTAAAAPDILSALGGPCPVLYKCLILPPTCSAFLFGIARRAVRPAICPSLVSLSSSLALSPQLLLSDMLLNVTFVHHAQNHTEPSQKALSDFPGFVTSSTILFCYFGSKASNLSQSD